MLDLTFAALSDPTRRSILALLNSREATVNEIVAAFDLSQPTISSHIKALEKAGLITKRREGTKRPCVVAPQALAQVDDWLGTYRDLWTDRFAQLAALTAISTEDGDDK